MRAGIRGVRKERFLFSGDHSPRQSLVGWMLREIGEKSGNTGGLKKVAGRRPRATGSISARFIDSSPTPVGSQGL